MKTDNEKQLIIIAHYIHIGHCSPSVKTERLIEAKKLITQNDYDPEYRFVHYVYGVENEENAKTECVFPR